MTSEVIDDTGAFLSVFASLLLDNVSCFEKTANEVTDLVMGHGRPTKEMIVTLQAFDRLKQEFEALGNALACYAVATNALPQSGEERMRLGQEVIAKVSVADLKDRLLDRLQSYAPKIPASQTPSLVADDVDVDVEF